MKQKSRVMEDVATHPVRLEQERGGLQGRLEEQLRVDRMGLDILK